MQTKMFYKDGLWEAISSHPQYNLGQRELAALIRFLPIVAAHAPQALDVLHLASATGREVPAIVSALPGIRRYLLDDIVPEVVERSRQQLQAEIPQVNFSAVTTDIEAPGEVIQLRQRLSQPILIVFTANSVIFSNRQMDSNIHQAMGKEDLLLLTLEETHPAMFDSYQIPPVYELLSQSGKRVDGNNVRVWYNNKTATMHMACEGEDLLVSYKPTAEQLRQRMTSSGFVEAAAERYADLHMLVELYRRG